MTYFLENVLFYGQKCFKILYNILNINNKIILTISDMRQYFLIFNISTYNNLNDEYIF